MNQYETKMYRTDAHGHTIIKSKNEEWCDHGMRCYHAILKGKNAHEFQRINFEDYCKRCG